MSVCLSVYLSISLSLYIYIPSTYSRLSTYSLTLTFPFLLSLSLSLSLNLSLIILNFFYLFSHIKFTFYLCFRVSLSLSLSYNPVFFFLPHLPFLWIIYSLSLSLIPSHNCLLSLFSRAVKPLLSYILSSLSLSLSLSLSHRLVLFHLLYSTCSLYLLFPHFLWVRGGLMVIIFRNEPDDPTSKVWRSNLHFMFTLYHLERQKSIFSTCYR